MMVAPSHRSVGADPRVAALVAVGLPLGSWRVLGAVVRGCSGP